MEHIGKIHKTAYRPSRAGFVIYILAFLMLMSPVRTLGETLSLEDWLDIGWDYYNAGNIEEAFNTFLEVVAIYPESAEAHLALGEMYIEKGIMDRGRNEILISLNLDDESELAARAHYMYALSIREEDPWNALLHLDRAHHLGGTQSLQFEIANQHRFCILLIQMPERAESGPVVLHFASYLLTQEDADSLAEKAEEALYLTETYVYFDVTEPMHIFLYTSERAVRAEVMFPEDDWDPEHREYHIPYSAELDFMPPMSRQVIYDLQQEINRHAGAQWVTDALHVAVSGKIEWFNPEIPDNEIPIEPGLAYIECDDAVRALYTESAFVDLKYLILEEYDPYVPWLVKAAELASFLNWVRRTYEHTKFQELITQPNVQIILDADLDTIQQDWINEITTEPNLISDPELALEFVQGLPLSPLSGDPELPLNVLKQGLSLYLSGEEVNGLWEIQHAIDLDPGLAIGYYALGWIATIEGDWEEAEEQLGLALLLYEIPEEVAWCHSLLVPIYLNQSRWEHAKASCRQIILYGASRESVDWALMILPRLDHIIALQPSEKLEISSYEFSLMRWLFELVDEDLNADPDESSGIEKYISEMMADEHSEQLVNFYESVIERYPSTTFQHEVISVGTIGAAIYAEVLVHATFPASFSNIPPALQALKRGGYLLLFQVVPSEVGWKFLDWEDAWFPDTILSYSIHEPAPEPVID